MVFGTWIFFTWQCIRSVEAAVRTHGDLKRGDRNLLLPCAAPPLCKLCKGLAGSVKLRLPILCPKRCLVFWPLARPCPAQPFPLGPCQPVLLAGALPDPSIPASIPGILPPVWGKKD